MPRNDLPWEKWFADAWLDDDQLSKCRDATQGVWIKAICKMMRNGTDRLTGTIEQLSRACATNAESMLLALNDLAETGAATVTRDGVPWEQVLTGNLMANPLANAQVVLVNRRRERQLAISKMRQEAGRQGAINRWQAECQKSEKGDGKPSSSTSFSESSSIPEGLQGEEFQTAWADWHKHRREIRKPVTPTAAAQQLRKLAEWGHARAVAAIRHSIANGWQGIFEPGPNGSGRPGNQPSRATEANKPGQYDWSNHPRTIKA